MEEEQIEPAEVIESESLQDNPVKATAVINSTSNEEMFRTQQSELFKRELSNSENYDKAILAYASGGLGISLAFIKDVVPLSSASCLALLELSWFCWVFAIVVVVISFQTSQFGIRRHLEKVKKYYLDDDDSALEAKNVPATLTDIANVLSGVLFLCGVVLTTAFVGINLRDGNVTKNSEGSGRRSTAMDGAPVPSLVKKVAPAPPKPAPPQPKTPPANKR